MALKYAAIITIVLGLAVAATAIAVAIGIFSPQKLTEEMIATDNTAHGNDIVATISGNMTYTLSGDMTLSFSAVHSAKKNPILELYPYQSAFPLGEDENRLPYLNITSDSYLELRNITKVMLTQINDPEGTAATNATAVEIINRGCNATEKAREDYTYYSIDYCTFEISHEQVAIEDIPKFEAMNNYTARLDFATRRPDLIKVYESAENSSGINKFMAIRFLGFTMGNDFRTSFDVITNYGVKNVNLQDAPLGYTERLVLGPEEIKIKVLDVATGNTRCDPTCRNVFEVSITVNTIDDPSKYPVKILSYY